MDWRQKVEKTSVVVQLLSHVQLFATPWTTVLQACLSFSISWRLLKLISTESMRQEKQESGVEKHEGQEERIYKETKVGLAFHLEVCSDRK